MMFLNSQIRPASKVVQLIQTILVFIVITLLIIPQFRVLSVYKFLWLFSIFFWFIIVFLHRPIFFLKMNAFVKVMLFFVGYTIIVPHLLGNEAIGNRFLSLAIIPFFYIFYNFNVATNNKKTNYNLIKWSIPLILFTTYNTLKQLLINPTISRQIKSGGENTIGLWKLGIGGYDFIYFLTFLSIIIWVFFFLKKLTLKNKIILGAIFIFILSVVIISNYFTALIMLFSSILVFHIFKNFSILKLSMILIGSTIMFFFGKLIMISILDIVIPFLPEGKNLVRLSTLKNDLGIQQNISFLNERDSYIIESFNGFLNHPIFGMVVNPINFNKGIIKNLGQHSQFFDTLALFGIIGFIQIYFIVKPFFIRLNDNINLKSFSLSILIATLIIYTFNNSSPLIGYSFFFVYPSIYDLIKDKANKI